MIEGWMMSPIRRRNLTDKLRTTYWFVPLLMSAAAVLLAVVLLAIDAAIPNSALFGKWYILQVDAPGAKGLMSTIAATVIGVVGVVFSVALVPLTITMAQFGFILLRKFMRDWTTQLVLGTYSATFVYCILLLLTFPPNMSAQSIPQVSVTFALLLFLASIGVLVLFFHHIATSLQASNVVAGVGAELLGSIGREYLADPVPGAATPPRDDATDVEALRATVLREGRPIAATGLGYIHAIAGDELLHLTAAQQLTLFVTRHAGEFVIPGDPLALAWPPQQVTAGVEKAVNDAWLLGEYRTLVQDIEFGVLSLVSIALIALSPAINNPFTAMLCLDQLAAALSALARRAQVSPYYHDDAGHLRVIADPTTFERLTDVAFSQIRQYGRSDAEVLRHMLRAIAWIAPHASTQAQRQALRRHATLVEHMARLSLPEEADQERVRQSFDATLQAIG
jgi:uncharacterized membrane protein